MSRVASFVSAISVALLFFFSPLDLSPVRAVTPTPTQPCISIEEAIQKNLVQATFRATGTLFWLDALEYSVTNKGPRPISICISAGQVFAGEDGGYQDLVVGRTVTINAASGETKKGKLYVFCANLKKSAPEADLGYSTKGMAEDDLLKVAQTIDKRRAYGRLGAQLAVWNVTDGFSLDELGDLSDFGASEDSDPIGIIQPLLALAAGEIKLGQEILDEAVPGAQLYTGELPPGILPDIPVLGEIPRVLESWDTLSKGYQRARSAGPLILFAIPLVCCIVPLAGLMSFVLLRRR